MEARSRWRSIINEKTIADFKRVAEQTGILTKEPDHPPQACWCPPAHHPYSATANGGR